MLSVIIPAHNESDCIGACLESLSVQSLDPAVTGGVSVVVAANGCTDDTVDRARAWIAPLAALGCELQILEMEEAGKAMALDHADAAANGDIRVYVDADVVLSRPLLGQLAEALTDSAPRFASGTLSLFPPKSYATRLFARVWTKLPFFSETAPCPGLYAVNAAGRDRWERFPDIISDDTFVRGLFIEEERVQVPAIYHWPLAEGAGRLLRARRRQEVGVREVAELYPGLKIRPAERHRARHLAKIALRDPVGVLVYAVLTGVAKLTANPDDRRWNSGRAR